MLSVGALEEIVLAKCGDFVEMQVWDAGEVLRPRRWLDNFTAAEREHALYLLHSFHYYSERLCDALFASSIQTLSSRFRVEVDDLPTTCQRWRTFIRSALFCPAVGETPNITDSGNIFASKVRKVLEVDQQQILTKPECLVELMNHGPRPVVFIDDFVGSGNQFIETWRAEVDVNFQSLSFTILHKRQPFPVYYCPLVCTVYGAERIQRKHPEVILNPAHIIGPESSPLHPDSKAWPDHLRATASEFIRTASARAGISDDDWMGFHDLALALAFFNGPPDATLPIFYHESESWAPLIRRL